MNTTHHAKKAYSLIEVIVVILLLAIVSVITIHYVVSASQLYASEIAQRKADNEAAAVVNRMRRETRLLTRVITADAGEFAFSNLTGAVAFRLSDTDITLNGNILARYVDTFALAYYNSTNGMLLPLPLDGLGKDSVSRVALELKLTRSGRPAYVNINLFRPPKGTRK